MQQISDDAYDAYLKERGLTREQYTTNELLAVAAAREVPNGAFVFAGTGLPLLASMLAQFTVAKKQVFSAARHNAAFSWNVFAGSAKVVGL